MNTSWGPSKVNAPSTPSCSSRRAWPGASSSPASIVSIFTEPPIGSCVHGGGAGASYGIRLSLAETPVPRRSSPPSGPVKGQTGRFTKAVAARQTSAVASTSFAVRPRKSLRGSDNVEPGHVWPAPVETQSVTAPGSSGPPKLRRVSERVICSRRAPSGGRSPRPTSERGHLQRRRGEIVGLVPIRVLRSCRSQHDSSPGCRGSESDSDWPMNPTRDCRRRARSTCGGHTREVDRSPRACRTARKPCSSVSK